MVEHVGEPCYFFLVAGFAHLSSVFQSFLYLPDARRTEAIFRMGHVVQGVAHAHPADGEVTVDTEAPIAEACVRKVAELDEKRFPQGFVRQALQHVVEDGLAVNAFDEVFARAEHFAPFDEGGRKQAHAASDGGQQLGYRFSVLAGYDEDRVIAGRSLVDAEQGGGVERIVPRQGRNVVSFAVCC